MVADGEEGVETSLIKVVDANVDMKIQLRQEVYSLVKENQLYIVGIATIRPLCFWMSN